MAIKLSLAPVSYYWPKQQLLNFYKEVANSAIDIVYLGEIICSKRLEMKFKDWMELAYQLKDQGKEVVLSTMTLIEASSERSRMRRVCEQEDFLIEANDFGAIDILSQAGKSFVTGNSINIYNERSLKILQKQGLKRWNLSVELGQEQLAQLQKNRPKGLQTEVMVWGRMPLAYSARCFTARSHNLPKDNCQFKCLDDPDGLLMKTRENQEFLCLNGIQTQSALSQNLIKQLEVMRSLEVDVIRINPQSHHTPEIINAFEQVVRQKQAANHFTSQLESHAPTAVCDGYWFGQAGMAKTTIPLNQVENI